MSENEINDISGSEHGARDIKVSVPKDKETAEAKGKGPPARKDTEQESLSNMAKAETEPISNGNGLSNTQKNFPDNAQPLEPTSFPNQRASGSGVILPSTIANVRHCLLYTSDAADDQLQV